MFGVKFSVVNALGMALLLESMMGLQVEAAFDVKQHLGNLSPFFKPAIVQGNGLSSAGGLGTGMPSGCVLEQVQMVRSPFFLHSFPIFVKLTTSPLSFLDATSRIPTSTV